MACNKGYIVKWTSKDENQVDILGLSKYYSGCLNWVERKQEAFVFKNRLIAERFIQYDSKEYDFPIEYYEVEDLSKPKLYCCNCSCKK